MSGTIALLDGSTVTLDRQKAAQQDCAWDVPSGCVLERRREAVGDVRSQRQRSRRRAGTQHHRCYCGSRGHSRVLHAPARRGDRVARSFCAHRHNVVDAWPRANSVHFVPTPPQLIDQPATEDGRGTPTPAAVRFAGQTGALPTHCGTAYQTPNSHRSHPPIPPHSGSTRRPESGARYHFARLAGAAALCLSPSAIDPLGYRRSCVRVSGQMAANIASAARGRDLSRSTKHCGAAAARRALTRVDRRCGLRTEPRCGIKARPQSFSVRSASRR